ncbi:hypothetical protein ACFY9S_40430 [Streptomyces sp. NPDC012474]|uniref:hypothetical protein n=1 Tax=Streptomyces sp. NPDC012474 TaxID=3364836 RepID=UPI0036E03531
MTAQGAEVGRGDCGPSDRARAKAFGYGAHFVNGLIFALLYYAVFVAIGYSSGWLGCTPGACQTLPAGTTPSG